MTTTKAIKIACYKFSSALAQKLAPTKREEEKVYSSSSSSFAIIHYKYVLFTIWQVG
jgi:hypothetical protein